MTLATTNAQRIWGDSRPGIKGHIGVAASTHIYEGRLLAQLTSGGLAVPLGTASSGVCIGASTHEQDNTADGVGGASRIEFEFDRVLFLANGTAGDAFSDTSQIGSIVFAADDFTALKTSSSQTRQAVGFFLGLDPDSGQVKVYLNPFLARFYVALAVPLTDSTTGVVTNTLHDVTATPTQVLINNNLASLAAKVNALLAVSAP